MFKTLLLAIDINDQESARRSTEAAVDLAKQGVTAFHILNVVPDQGMPIVSASMAADHGEKMVDAARRALERWAGETIPSELPVELHIVQGVVYDQIIKTAARLDVACIVVGAHSPSLKDYLIGPNAARVARHATQSVLVVR